MHFVVASDTDFAGRQGNELRRHKGVVQKDGAFVLLHFVASELDSAPEPGSELRRKEVSRIIKEIEH